MSNILTNFEREDNTIPDGQYHSYIENIEVAPFSKLREELGDVLLLKWKILEECSYKGFIITQRITIAYNDSSDPKKKDIILSMGRRQLTTLINTFWGRDIKVPTPFNPLVLKDKQAILETKINDDGYLNIKKIIKVVDFYDPDSIYHDGREFEPSSLAPQNSGQQNNNQNYNNQNYNNQGYQNNSQYNNQPRQGGYQSRPNYEQNQYNAYAREKQTGFSSQRPHTSDTILGDDEIPF